MNNNKHQTRELLEREKVYSPLLYFLNKQDRIGDYSKTTEEAQYA